MKTINTDAAYRFAFGDWKGLNLDSLKSGALIERDTSYFGLWRCTKTGERYTTSLLQQAHTQARYMADHATRNKRQ